MEISDEYQDMGNPGGGVAMANMTLGHHRHTPDSPMVSCQFTLFQKKSNCFDEVQKSTLFARFAEKMRFFTGIIKRGNSGMRQLEKSVKYNRTGRKLLFYVHIL